MSFWTAVVWIVAIAAFVKIRTAKYQAQSGGAPSLEPAQIASSQREAELKREVEDLRERVRVLERIATDGRSTAALADEIESLRGPQD
ncbi:MAG: hypothetical protein ACKOW1_07330 [Novosphingobium sp.]|jgi:cell division protein FtsL